MDKGKIKELYGTAGQIRKQTYKDFRKPLDPDDIILTPIEAYKGLCRLNQGEYNVGFLWGMMLAIIIIILFF